MDTVKPRTVSTPRCRSCRPPRRSCPKFSMLVLQNVKEMILRRLEKANLAKGGRREFTVARRILLLGSSMGRSFESVRMGVKDVFSNEAPYALDDLVEAAVFFPLLWNG